MIFTIELSEDLDPLDSSFYTISGLDCILSGAKENGIRTIYLSDEPINSIEQPINTSKQLPFDRYENEIKNRLKLLSLNNKTIEETTNQMMFSLKNGFYSKNRQGFPNKTEDDFLYAINCMMKLFRQNRWKNPLKEEKE